MSPVRINYCVLNILSVLTICQAIWGGGDGQRMKMTFILVTQEEREI